MPTVPLLLIYIVRNSRILAIFSSSYFLQVLPFLKEVGKEKNHLQWLLVGSWGQGPAGACFRCQSFGQRCWYLWYLHQPAKALPDSYPPPQEYFRTFITCSTLGGRLEIKNFQRSSVSHLQIINVSFVGVLYATRISVCQSVDPEVPVKQGSRISTQLQNFYFGLRDISGFYLRVLLRRVLLLKPGVYMR